MCLLVFGCYPEGGEYVEDYDALYTNYDPEFDFGATYTYSIPDKVLDLDESSEGDAVYIDQPYSSAILETLISNLNALGWTKVAPENADVVLVTGAFDDTYIAYNPWWWDWYYPWYGPGWGWYYPGYSPGYVSGYSTGSVIVQMTYPDGTSADDEVPVVWLGALNGLLQGGQNNIISRVTSNLDQAFNQPPFNN
ncbi:DUF4136 domain-containing protein [Tamlana sp. 2_MG-2023]|nr:DUF4136 domain-containing protein [Tamlana sp. 2_MG-2023]MDO6761446.1 DUF4136 domain-containing protein [Tamlana sp. 2_MG-2023]